MIVDENSAYLSAHHQNIDHYRRLLRTSLTALERNFIERRIAEERKALDRLASETLPERGGTLGFDPIKGDVS